MICRLCGSTHILVVIAGRKARDYCIHCQTRAIGLAINETQPNQKEAFQPC